MNTNLKVIGVTFDPTLNQTQVYSSRGDGKKADWDPIKASVVAICNKQKCQNSRKELLLCNMHGL